ncbi:hypothetical protein LXT21_44225 [Myxococcus sp. K38C18041901]|uniref:hypothetical protein n=1 Tax=Myxococcus guangdongensis TaxID=2906760 RepID=UPI0020A73A8B|nr:hypothetical protein [Myxococcus guangdongensis]MCP3065797.1 hypothetical protein [Myxococcus guangdongensis]
MTALADRLARKSLALLAKYGQAASLTRRTVGEYDVATSTRTSSSVSYPLKVLVQSDSGQDKEGDSLQEGTAVRAARRKLLVGAHGLPVVPGPGDEVGPLEGRTWRVLAVDPPVQLGGTPILFTLRVASA